MWKCKKVYPTRGRLAEQLSDLEMSQQVGSIAENEVGEMDHRGKTRRIRAVFGTVESTG
jgi:hypothetical protein